MSHRWVQACSFDIVSIRFFPPSFVRSSVISGNFRQPPSRPGEISCDHCCCCRWRVGGVAWRGHLRVGQNKSAASEALEWRRAPVSVRAKCVRCFWRCDAGVEGVGLFGANAEETKRSWRRGAFVAGWREGSCGYCWESWQKYSLMLEPAVRVWKIERTEGLCVSDPKWLNYVKLSIIYEKICAVFLLYQRVETTDH